MAEPEDRSASRDADLDDRIRRLETALAERPAPNEDVIADHVIAKLSALAAERERQTGSQGALVLASAVDAPAPPEGAVLRPPGPPPDPTSRTWFFSNVIAELRLIFSMYFDPRYRISRTTQFALPGLVLLLIFNYCLFSLWIPIPFLSPVLERLLAVILGILIYKLLTREVIRYREVLAYLARYGR
jgi:hypothetical protein